MKKSLLCFSVAFTINYFAVAQPCPMYISFDNQSEVDNFQYDYPGCTSIEGGVTIGSNITNLNGLTVLTSIGGNLSFYYAVDLGSLSGLDNLSYIGGHLRIANTNITDLSGLESLSYIDADLWIDSNPNLTSLNGLEGLDSVGQRAVISDNNALASLDGLSSLISAGSGLFIEDNAALTSLSGLDSFTTSGGRLEIKNNDVLTDLSSLAGVISVENRLTLLDNDLLNNLFGLHNIQSVGWDLTIQKNRSLTSLEGLNNLESIAKSLRIIENENLTSLSGMDLLTFIGETLEIHSNYELTDVGMLANVNPDALINLSVYSNPLLSNCEIQSLCEYLISPNGKVIIHHNGEGCNHVVDIASACDIVLPCLPYGDYYFISQAHVDNFPVDFPDCIQLEGTVVINGANITDLGGLQQVILIEQALHFWDNPSLTSLAQLYNLSHLGEGLVLVNNDAITSLEGINNLDLGENNSLFIINNDILSVCNQDNVCYFINNFGGRATISVNAPGCSSLSEVAEACGVLFVGQADDAKQINAFPNPFSSSTTLSIALQEPSVLKIQIFNLQGQKVDEILSGQPEGKHELTWNAEGESPGVYFYRMAVNNQIITGKLILIK